MHNPANRTYPTSRGHITISCHTPEQWHNLAICLGRPELSYEGSWDVARDASSNGPIARVIEEMFREDTAESWKQRLDAHEVPCTIDE